MFTVEKLGAGALVRATGHGGLQELPVDVVVDQLRDAGALVLRGFGTAPGEFAAFTDRFSRTTLGRLHVGQNRDQVATDGTTSTVNLGMQHVGPHAEMGYSPQRPDLLWFYCAVPPASGGETTLFDGIRVWESLPDELREKCAATELEFSYPGEGPDFWPLFTGVPADRATTLDLLAAQPGVTYELGDGNTIDVRYRVPAAPPSRFQRVPAFANSIIPSTSTDVAFADGTPVRPSDRLAIMRTCAGLMTPVAWERGDVIMIDNSRMMHGRLPFSDPARQIHVRMTTAAF